MKVADVCIKDLAAAEADLAERLALAEDRAHVWKLFAKEALHRVYGLTRERDGARAQLSSLRRELRRYTAAVVAGRRAA